MILVTGATGLVGGALVHRLIAQGDQGPSIAVAVRRQDRIWPEKVRSSLIGDLLASTDWTEALKDVSAVVHCAARVHVMSDTENNPIQAYRRVNVQGTLNLARQAAQSGVKRFVFVSSIKVNGETTVAGRPFFADDIPAPVDPYGQSKWEAELGLRQLSIQTGMEVVIVRPPLVYGPNVQANFATMLRWVAKGVPLPFGRIYNTRSMVGLDNLVDLLSLCLTHPAAAGQTFLVSDGQDLSTTELLRRTARAMGKKAILIPVPMSWLNRCAALIGRPDVAQRLCGSLQVNIEKTCTLLNWTPPFTVDEGLTKTVSGMAR